MHPVLGTWLLINAVACYIIVIFSFIDSDAYITDRLFFPKVVRCLREDLNLIGTILATAIIIILFLPALLLYFAVISLIGIIVGFIKLFGYAFRRRS